jgi:hypothetical protein
MTSPVSLEQSNARVSLSRQLSRDLMERRVELTRNGLSLDVASWLRNMVEPVRPVSEARRLSPLILISGIPRSRSRPFYPPTH